MCKCSICESEFREAIERALMLAAPTTADLEKIASDYNVSVEELQRHVMFHSPLGSIEDDSIARQIKMRETNLLAAAAYDYASTLSLVGSRIRKRAAVDNEDGVFERSITKPIADLYTGCGAELRNTVKAVADINQLLNGPKDNDVNGLQALAEALRSSRKGCEEE